MAWHPGNLPHPTWAGRSKPNEQIALNIQPNTSQHETKKKQHVARKKKSKPLGHGYFNYSLLNEESKAWAGWLAGRQAGGQPGQARPGQGRGGAEGVMQRHLAGGSDIFHVGGYVGGGFVPFGIFFPGRYFPSSG